MILCPAAGYGRRMGSPDAKELLPHPFKNKKMIEVPLEYAQKHHMHVHVISREDKVALNNFLESRSEQNVSFQKIQVTGEWPESILKSKFDWGEQNLLWLPDTDFDQSVIQKIFLLLDQYEIVFATFSVSDPHLWGLIRETDEGFEIGDKPAHTNPTDKAWGLIGFRKNAGEHLFTQIHKSNQDKSWKAILTHSLTQVSLEYFVDLTRG